MQELHKRLAASQRVRLDRAPNRCNSRKINNLINAPLIGTRIAIRPVVNRVIENLLVLQELVLERRDQSAVRESRIEKLRTDVPEPILSQFDRWMARHRKAVAVVSNGVCGECHLRLTVGTIGALAFGDAIQRCGNCGRFLYLPEDEPVSSPPPDPPVKPARFNKKASSHGG